MVGMSSCVYLLPSALSRDDTALAARVLADFVKLVYFVVEFILVH